MGRDKILTSWLNKIHKSYRTPFRAILITGIVILGLIAFGVGIETLADVASFSFLITYALVHVAVIVMRRAAPEDYQPDFRLSSWAYPLIPLLGVLSCLIIVAQMRPVVLIIGGSIIGVGVLWYLVYAAKRALKPSLVGRGPNSVLAVKRGIEIAKSIKKSSLTLLTVQSLTPSTGKDPKIEGKNLINSTVRSIGLNPDDFASKVVVADDIRNY